MLVRWLRATWVVAGIFFYSGCLKIDDFDKPGAHEVYTGTLEVDAGIEDATSGYRGPGIITVRTMADGNTVYISGVPPDSPFYIVPEDLFDDDKLRPFLMKAGIRRASQLPNVAGLVADVVDGGTLEVKGFASANELARKLNLTVKGKIVRHGAECSTIEPIEIWGKMKEFKKYFPKELLREFLDKEIGKSIVDMDDSKEYLLFRFTFQGEPITVTG